MLPDTETGQFTGTKDKDYNLLWFTETCLSNALRMEVYRQDAERAGDQELADFFRKAQHESRKGAERGKQLLASRLGQSLAQPIGIWGFGTTRSCCCGRSRGRRGA